MPAFHCNTSRSGYKLLLLSQARSFYRIALARYLWGTFRVFRVIPAAPRLLLPMHIITSHLHCCTYPTTRNANRALNTQTRVVNHRFRGHLLRAAVSNNVCEYADGNSVPSRPPWSICERTSMARWRRKDGRKNVQQHNIICQSVVMLCVRRIYYKSFLVCVCACVYINVCVCVSILYNCGSRSSSVSSYYYIVVPAVIDRERKARARADAIRRRRRPVREPAPRPCPVEQLSPPCPRCAGLYARDHNTGGVPLYCTATATTAQCVARVADSVRVCLEALMEATSSSSSSAPLSPPSLGTVRYVRNRNKKKK